MENFHCGRSEKCWKKATFPWLNWEIVVSNISHTRSVHTFLAHLRSNRSSNIIFQFKLMNARTQETERSFVSLSFESITTIYYVALIAITNNIHVLISNCSQPTSVNLFGDCIVDTLSGNLFENCSGNKSCWAFIIQ